MSLHPFERLFSAQGCRHKPHCFRYEDVWYKVDVPIDSYYPDRHLTTGRWLRAKNAKEGHLGRVTLEAGAPVVHSAVSRRAARHHG